MLAVWHAFSLIHDHSVFVVFLSPGGTGVHCTLQMNYWTEPGSYYLWSEWQPNKEESNTHTNCDWSSPTMQCREEIKQCWNYQECMYQHLKIIFMTYINDDVQLSCSDCNPRCYYTSLLFYNKIVLHYFMLRQITQKYNQCMKTTFLLHICTGKDLDVR
jgi:hypothetical protein